MLSKITSALPSVIKINKTHKAKLAVLLAMNSYIFPAKEGTTVSAHVLIMSDTDFRRFSGQVCNNKNVSKRDCAGKPQDRLWRSRQHSYPEIIRMSAPRFPSGA